MNTEDKIRELSRAISAFRFTSYDTQKNYEWLISKCRAMIALLREHNAQPKLINALLDVVSHLEEQDRVQTHPLVREQVLLFQQDAIIFYLMREGYAKMPVDSKAAAVKQG